MKSNIVKMSLAAAMLLSSAAYSGKIIGLDAGTPYNETQIVPPTQYGFGGWNFDNVNVKITDLEFVELPGTLFDTTDGAYSTMTYGDTFESEILDADQNVMGRLHGKNWPVGEPAGIKIINNDTGTATSGKSPNCIMTTSYLDANATGKNEPSGYLDTDFTPVPTVCSSPFQTHKRFKINMQPEMLVDYDIVTGYGKSMDLVFNLDPNDANATARRYQVFQKINNYTGMRLEGYKIEVLDANGDQNVSKIKFSLDLSTKTDSDSDESGYEAVFSNGLWGPKDATVRKIPHFTEDGFFDKVRAGFKQEGNDTTLVTGGPVTLGSNYVDLFGIWLPSKWAPYGIFFDDDNDTTTDAELVAFWGTAPTDPVGTAPAWHKGNDYNGTDVVEPWDLVTAADLEKWNVNAEGSLYSIGKIEDTLNLGLNYVVEVGLNSTIGKTFTIRITPRVAPLEAQTPPSYIDDNGDYILPPELDLIAPTANAGDDKTVQVNNTITITGSGTDTDGTIVSYEWKYGTTVVARTASFNYTPSTVGTAILTLTVTDNDGLTDTDSMTLTVTATDDSTTSSGGGGGGCTYNPNSKNFDMTFLLMMALGLLYPFRRRFLK